ncbi:MAG: DUF4093 domain-containing protein [Oscillospiraceae bacterium]|nr:DUF4093 domain-containing protein [Oscillospiraceae bacterium]
MSERAADADAVGTGTAPFSSDAAVSDSLSVPFPSPASPAITPSDTLRPAATAKLRIREAIVVEGKYDMLRLQSLVDTLIIPVDGFTVFRRPGTLALLRRLGAARGLILLTDSDDSGFLIRDYLSGALPPEQIRHAYIPALPGKERRKRTSSAAGLLGVEGMDTPALEKALRAAGATFGEVPSSLYLTKADFFADGFAGTANSASRRRALAAALGLPPLLSANRLLAVLNATLTPDEYVRLKLSIRFKD